MRESFGGSGSGEPATSMRDASQSAAAAARVPYHDFWDRSGATRPQVSYWPSLVQSGSRRKGPLLWRSGREPNHPAGKSGSYGRGLIKRLRAGGNAV